MSRGSKTIHILENITGSKTIHILKNRSLVCNNRSRLEIRDGFNCIVRLVCLKELSYLLCAIAACAAARRAIGTRNGEQET